MARAPRNRTRTNRARINRRKVNRRKRALVPVKPVTKLASMSTFGLGLPRKALVTHRYVSSIILTSTSGAIAKHQFSANGMFDPDITATGHQPLYFDQFTALYDHYTVIGSKITVKLCSGTANEAAGQFAMMLNDDTSSTNITDPEHAFEQSQHSNRLTLIPPNSNNSYAQRLTWSPKKVFGGSILANDALQGTVSANPTEQSYYDLYFSSFGSATTTCAIQVLIEYIAVWDELKEVAQS